jgi:cyclin C
MVATACLYVASKVEETPLHVRSVIVEAARAWTEYGHTSFPTSGTGLAEMEFYLLRDLDYHLVLHHPYRPMMAIVGAAGKTALEKAEAEPKSRAAKGGATLSSRGQAGLGSQAEALGVGSSKLGQPNFDMASLSQAEVGKGGATEEQDRAKAEEEMARRAMTAGDYGLPVARAEEIDDGVVQMAW